MRAQPARVLPRRGLLQIGAYEAENDTLEEHARLRRLHIRDEDPRGGVRSLRRPLLGRCEREDARPRGERRDDFERLGKRARAVASQELADSGVIVR